MNTYILPDYKIKTTKNYYRIKIELKKSNKIYPHISLPEGTFLSAT